VGLTPQQRNLLSQKAAMGEFGEVPNRTHVWQEIVDLHGESLTVFAVQTES
jgi:hypothetical protein